MNAADYSRRDFLLHSLSGAGAAWLAAQWPEILAAHGHAMQAVASGAPAKLEFLNPAQAADVEAVSAAIIPTTDTPGAREAGVVYFVDRGLMTFAQDQREPLAQGLKVLTALTRELFPGSESFASLAGAQQLEVLQTLEAEKPDDQEKRHKPPRASLAGVDGQQIFGMFRFMTVLGVFANPEYGGNRNRAGWELLNFKPAMAHFPPFGYYDKEYREQHPAQPAGSKPGADRSAQQ